MNDYQLFQNIPTQDDVVSPVRDEDNGLHGYLEASAASKVAGIVAYFRGLCNAYMGNQKYASAKRMLDEIRRLTSRPQDLDCHLLEAECLILMGQHHEESVKSFHSALMESDMKAIHILDWANALREQKRFVCYILLSYAASCRFIQEYAESPLNVAFIGQIFEYFKKYGRELLGSSLHGRSFVINCVIPYLTTILRKISHMSKHTLGPSIFKYLVANCSYNLMCTLKLTRQYQRIVDVACELLSNDNVVRLLSGRRVSGDIYTQAGIAYAECNQMFEARKMFIKARDAYEVANDVAREVKVQLLEQANQYLFRTPVNEFVPRRRQTLPQVGFEEVIWQG